MVIAHTPTVFPTPVGVFLDHGFGTRGFQRLPHARGGVSIPAPLRPAPLPSSPRPWGCFSAERGIEYGVIVFPTPVGVFPS